LDTRVLELHPVVALASGQFFLIGKDADATMQRRIAFADSA
jgi:hypothetical protein